MTGRGILCPYISLQNQWNTHGLHMHRAVMVLLCAASLQERVVCVTRQWKTFSPRIHLLTKATGRIHPPRKTFQRSIYFSHALSFH